MQVKYLGHMVSQKGVELMASKVEAILQWPVPQSTWVVRSFLGLAGFYRRFIKGYATIAGPLVKLITKDPFKWTPQAQLAFDHLKTALSTALALTKFSASFHCGDRCIWHRHGCSPLTEQPSHCFFQQTLQP